MAKEYMIVVHLRHIDEKVSLLGQVYPKSDDEFIEGEDGTVTRKRDSKKFKTIKVLTDPYLSEIQEV